MCKIYIRAISCIFVLLIGYSYVISQYRIAGHEFPIDTKLVNGKNIQYTPGLVVFVTNPPATIEQATELISSYSGEILRWLRIVRSQEIAIVAKIAFEHDPFQVATELSRSDLIKFAEPNYILKHAVDDTYYGDQWSLNQGSDVDIDMPEAWSITTGSTSVKIAILDSGIPMDGSSLDHEDLNDASHVVLVSGADIYNADDYPEDNNGHGTKVAGIIGAETNNNTGIAGIGYNCKIMPIKVGLTQYDFLLGVIKAIYNGAKVINYSIYGDSPNGFFELGIEYAQEDGCLIVAAAGNDSENEAYPGLYSTSFDNVIAVSATDDEDDLYVGNNYGSWINVSAPGVDILTTYLGDDYDYVTGTSFAAPHVSGLAGLLYSVNGSLAHSWLREIIELTAKDLGASGFDEYYGHGRINAYRAVKNADEQFTTSGTIENGELWWDTVTITDNLTIPSDAVLAIKPGTTISVSTGKKITVNGTLLAGGTDSDRITFTSTSGTWYGIEVNNGGHFNPDFSDFENAQYPIDYYDSDGDVHTCTFTDYSTAIRYDNTSWGKVDYSTIIEYGATGLDFVQYSSGDIRSYNEIQDNYYGVKIDSNSDPNLGYTAGGGYNSIYNAVWDVYSTNSSTLDAIYNWWGSSSPSPSIYGNVDWDPYLTSDPISKQSASRPPKIVHHESSNPSDTVGVREFNDAKLIFQEGDTTATLALLRNLITKYSDYNIGRQAFAFEVRILRKIGQSNKLSDRLKEVSQSYSGKEISGLAKSIEVGTLVRIGDYEQAVNTASQVATDFSGTNLHKYALYDLGRIHWYNLGDTKTGEIYYRRLIDEYPEDHLSISALATLGEWEPKAQSLTDNKPNPQLAGIEAIPQEFSISQNYPNPFNPTTEIGYELPETGRVAVTIYNLLGERIYFSDEGVNPAGRYSMIWKGVNSQGTPLASGLYIYEISFAPTATPNQAISLSGKMRLVR